MIRPLAGFAVLYATAVGVWALGLALLRRRPGTTVRGSVLALETVLLAQAGFACVTLLSGHRPAELATHLGYLVTSVLLVPGLPLLTRAPSEPPEHIWTTAVTGIACLAAAIVTVRLWITWQP